MADDLPFRSEIMGAMSAGQPKGIQGHAAAPRLQADEEAAPDPVGLGRLFWGRGFQLDSADRASSKAGWQKNSCLPGRLMVGREPGTKWSSARAARTMDLLNSCTCSVAR